jgi:uncharacterized membrane protein
MEAKRVSIIRPTTITLAILMLAFVYLFALASRQWTWVFVSGDSGDWLASSLTWMVPQPYGSPLYILLGHLVNLLPVGNLVWNMTLLLSVVPAAITVSLVYLIVKQVGLSDKLAILGSGILLACGIFLSQATILEEYSLATMFVSLAFLFYLRGNRKLTALFLGLGTAVHIIVLFIALLWLFVTWQEWKGNKLKAVFIYLLGGIAPYTLILVLMALDTPKLIAGGLSLSSLNAYLGSSGTIGKISLSETPERLLQAAEVLLLAFGIGLIPLWYGLKRPWSTSSKVMIVVICFCFWLYITDTDSSTWTFLMFGLPLATAAILIGISRLPRWTYGVTVISVIAFLFTNGYLLNANVLSKDRPVAMGYYQSVQELPDKSSVILPKGGPYGLGIMYIMAQGKDLTPIFLMKEEGWSNRGYQDYLKWIQNHKRLPGDNWIQQIVFSLQQGRQTFVAYQIQPPEWQEQIDARFEIKAFNKDFMRVVSKKQIVSPTTVYNSSITDRHSLFVGQGHDDRAQTVGLYSTVEYNP